MREVSVEWVGRWRSQISGGVRDQKVGRQRVRMEGMETSLEKLDLEEKKGVGGAVVRRKKHFLPSSFNDRTSLSLFKYWWEEARREREQRYHKGTKEAEGMVPQVEGCTPGGRRDTPPL